MGSFAVMTMYSMSDLQYQAVYNCLSFALASMMSTTMFLWFRSTAVADKYKSAVLISGLVTFIAAYHYMRIFNSWVDAYHYSGGKVVGGALEMQAPTLTGFPFNDAYRYMDWLLTVPLLLIEILLVMKLDDATFSSKAWNLGVGSALMIASGYYGELVVSGDLTPRWMCWAISMIFFLYIVNELLNGLAEATAAETDPYRRKDPNCTGVDRDQLVHIPRCVLVPNDGHQCCTCRRRHSGWLLLLRHHLQVRCGNRDLPDLLREVQQRELPTSLRHLAFRLLVEVTS